ncbi:ABC transporter ATP-binding protein [Microscilla marina]|uniref:ABC transporter permease and ATP-binding protein n=1 Tax=Microscilla marina ATCC 23134 TaxID=313606 RepID=A1ZE49_MICM2|nr:ABC transporter ATP-binding protein [Microscilla marina]EAY31357.1 ABC transporter permease and ATP-binding protein [Microscilla marina ATCC 23134]
MSLAEFAPKMSRRRRSNPPKTSFKENLKAFKNLPKFFRLIWETNKTLTFTNIVLRLLASGLPLAMLYVGKMIMDIIVVLYKAGNIQHWHQTPELWQWILVELGLAVLADLLKRGITLLDALLGDLFNNETSIKLMEQAARLDLPQFEDSEFYDKLERARRQTTTRVVLLSLILSQAQGIITMLFLGAGLMFFNPWLILLLVISVIPAFLSETYFNRSKYSLSLNWTPERRELDYLRYVGASDETAKEVKIFGLSDFLTSRFKLLAYEYYYANRKLATRRAMWGGLFNALGSVGYYVAYALIVFQTVQGTLSIGTLTFLAGSFNRLRELTQKILSDFSSIAQQALYLQDLFDFFEIKPLIFSPDQSRPIPKKILEGFVFENVSFKYPNTNKWAVKNISFTLKAGEKLALVGENGAGKTTLIKLLTRLYDPTEGHILLDGYDLKEYDLTALRQLIGVIFQDYVKFQMNVSENIAIGKIDERDEPPKIVHAAEQSLADKVIEKLPDGYGQMLGRRFANGVELSGGEWQKIALSRAYMRDAQLIVLDEPTSALDARAEYEVFQRFAALTQGKSAVLISHRFSTVRMADRIMVLKQGQQVELGSHEELLAQDGYYAELFNLQAKGYR